MEGNPDSWVDVEGANGPVKMPVVLAKDVPQLPVKATIDGKTYPVVRGRTISIVVAKGNAGQIIPEYIKQAMPKWFGLLFLLTLLAAAMSTLSSQFHTVGTSIGRDVYEQLTNRHEHSIVVNRAGIIIGIVIAMLWSYYARGGYIIAVSYTHLRAHET